MTRLGKFCLPIVVAALAVTATVAAPAAFADVSNLTVVDVLLFNPTDSGATSGYLQAAIDVQYSCTSGTTGTISGTYDTLSKSESTSLSCTGQAVETRLFTRMPVTEKKAPAQPNVTTDAVDVSYSFSGGAGGDLEQKAATVAATAPQASISDLFPPYQLTFASRVGLPTQQFAIFEPPLTTGGRTIDHYRVNYRLAGGKLQHVKLGNNDVIHNLHTHSTYSISISVVTTDGSSATTKAQTVVTPRRVHQHVTLMADHTSVHAHHAVTLSGQVSPQHGGHVILQKHSDGSWHAIGDIDLDHDGTFRHTVHPDHGTAKYRVKSPGNLNFTSALSPSVSVHVHH